MKHNFKTQLLIFGFLFGLVALMPLQSIACSASNDNSNKEEFNVSKLIKHHILDSHEWHILDYKDASGKKHSFTIPLPIILWTDNGLVTFMSSSFNHGKLSVDRKEQTFSIDDHNHITTKNGTKVMDFSITKNVASMMLSVAILVLVFMLVAAGYKKRVGQTPKGIQSLMEPLIIFLRDEVVIPNIGEKKYKTYLPYILTLFFFIWVNNLLGLLPTGANLSGNIAFTMTLAVLTLLITNFAGNKNYWSHIFWTPGVPLPLRLIMLPVELIGILTKPFALMIRLFANITAGHIVILSLVSFIFMFKSVALGLVVGPVVIAMTFLELFVAILQAYIFALLSALFIGMAVEEHH